MHRQYYTASLTPLALNLWAIEPLRGPRRGQTIGHVRMRGSEPPFHLSWPQTLTIAHRPEGT